MDREMHGGNLEKPLVCVGHEEHYFGWVGKIYLYQLMLTVVVHILEVWRYLLGCIF
jgi:hypothetical protein